ncbi:MAG: hypothetical protein QOD74_2412 [Variibacter sp.]|nr:hypothetical protein [Variibacter sp.]
MLAAKRSCRGSFAAVAAFLVASVWLAWPWLSGRVTIPWDAKSQFYPQLRFLADALHRGDSPFWAPNIFAGWPQIADPQSLIFSPLHFLLAWVDPAPGFRAFDAVSFAALFIGGVSIILFFRDRGWHMAGAIVAALAFSFGGSCLSRIQHTGQILSIAYVPLSIWLVGRAIDRRSLLWVVAAGIALGLLAIGRDQVALLGLYCVAAFAVVHAWRLGPRRALIPLATCAVVAAAVAVVPVTLTALLAFDSNRPDIDFIAAGRGSLHPAHLLTLAFGDLYGAADPNVDYWAPPSFAWKQAWGATDLFLAQNMGQLYAGALVVVAVVGAGLLRGAAFRREIVFFSAAAAFCLVYALGWYTPVFRFLYAVAPGVDMFRRPADATFVLNFALAVLAGYCVHAWLTDPKPAWSRRRRMLSAAAALSIVAAAVGVAMGAGKLSVAAIPLLTGIIFAALAMASLIAARRLNARSPTAVMLALAAVLAIDFAWNRAVNESTGLPPAIYAALLPETQNETVRLVQEKLASTDLPRADISAVAYHWPNIGLAQGFPTLFGQNPLRLRDFSLATGVGDTVAIPEQRTFASLCPSFRSTLPNLLGLKLVVTGVPVEKIDPSLRAGDLLPVAQTKDAYVYENPRALPRIMLVPNWRQADFEKLLAEGWPGADPRRTVLLEREPQFTPAALPLPGSTRIVRYSNTEVVIEAETPGGAFLVLNDVWHPWWIATVDGKPAEILKANVLFRAVPLPSGQHIIRFEFAPLSQAWRQLVQKLRAIMSPAWMRSA